MIDFQPTVTVPSDSLPGVSCTVRRMSCVARATRDLTVAEEQLRVAELRERITIEKRDWPDIKETAEDGTVMFSPNPGMPLDVTVRIARYDREMGALIDGFLKPATIRAGLVSIEGLTYAGETPTAELLLANGPDSLIDEIWTAILLNAALTQEKKETSPSPSTSEDPEQPADRTTTAATANGNHSTATETAAAGSRKT